MNRFSITMNNKESHCIDGESLEEISMRIDGLRLQGKRWLKVYDSDPHRAEFLGDDGYWYDGNWDVYVNIDHIVSIKEI